jgi:hypothetical protein
MAVKLPYTENFKSICKSPATFAWIVLIAERNFG